MFELEKAVAEWRRLMSAGGIGSPDLLDELEVHLREETQELEQAGLGAREAFEIAARKIGLAPSLKREFDLAERAAGTLAQKWLRALFPFAYNPNLSLANVMNTSNPNPEPAWATYAKAFIFVAPALLLWALFMVFVFPKVNEVCRDAGMRLPAAYRYGWMVKDHFVLLGAGFALAVVLLERLFAGWPRYRRVVLGTMVFLLNSTVLVWITGTVVLALMALEILLHQVK